MRRQLFLAVAGAAAISAIGACSSFSDSPETPTAEAGADAEPSVDGAASDADAGGVAEGGPNGCAACEVVATTDMATIVDVRLDDRNVLWTTTTGQPWNAPGTVMSASQTGTSQTPTDVLGLPMHVLGSLVTDGTTAQHDFVSFLSSSEPEFSRVPLDGASHPALDKTVVGPFSIRLAYDSGFVYWLSRAGGTTLWSWDSSGVNVSSIDTVADANVSDLAIKPTVRPSSAPIAYILEPGTGILARRAGGGGAPFVQISAVPDATSLAVTSSALFWGTKSGNVSTCDVVEQNPSDIPQCIERPLLALTNDAIANIIASGQTLFVATLNGSIYACPMGATCAGVTPMVQNAPLFDDTEYLDGHTIAANATTLFWAEGGKGQPHRIMRMAR